MVADCEIDRHASNLNEETVLCLKIAVTCWTLRATQDLIMKLISSQNFSRTLIPIKGLQMATKKKSSLPVEKKDYFKLPFEVYYSGPVEVIYLDFKSNTKVKRFKDVKTVHMEIGQSWGLNFYCEVNKGPQLYCCIANRHDEVKPDWLNFQDEENMEFNSGMDYAVVIKGDEISFVEDDTINELEDLETCSSSSFLTYRLDSSSPDYIILDANDSRLKVNSDGYAIDEENNPIESQRIFNPNELDEEKYEDFSRRDLWEEKFEWVKQTLQTDFPKDINLKLSYDTE